MKLHYKYFKKIRTDLKVFLLVAFLSYFSIELWFKNYPAIFLGAGKIADFFSKISLAYITSFLFYYLNVHIKSEKDKMNINEVVGHDVYLIILNAHQLIAPLQQRIDPNAKFEYLEGSKLSKLLKSIDRTAREAPYTNSQGIRANWIEWYAQIGVESKKLIDKVFSRYNHLDTKLIKILSRLENSPFYTQFDLLEITKHDNSFNCFYIQIEGYITHIKELEKFAEKNLKEFRHLKSDFIGWSPNKKY